MRWHWHYPKSFLVGFSTAPGWFLLHLGPGLIEWGWLDTEKL